MKTSWNKRSKVVGLDNMTADSDLYELRNLFHHWFHRDINDLLRNLISFVVLKSHMSSLWSQLKLTIECHWLFSCVWTEMTNWWWGKHRDAWMVSLLVSHRKLKQLKDDWKVHCIGNVTQQARKCLTPEGPYCRTFKLWSSPGTSYMVEIC